ncbi:hypothetical protein ES703_60495 [subsurface metagenome]
MLALKFPKFLQVNLSSCLKASKAKLLITLHDTEKGSLDKTSGMNGGSFFAFPDHRPVRLHQVSKFLDYFVKSLEVNFSRMLLPILRVKLGRTVSYKFLQAGN